MSGRDGSLEHCPRHERILLARGGWCSVCFRYWRRHHLAALEHELPEETDDQFLSRMLGRNVRFPG